MDPEEKKRRDAIKRYLYGEKASKIYKSYSKTKRWFYFWLNRYKTGNEYWYKNKSKKNKKIHNKTSADIEKLVCKIRKKLMNTKYSQIGALKIKWGLSKLGINPLPETWTINRIIKRNNLTRKKPKYIGKSRPYPALEVNEINYLHQLDLVGPRYIGKGKKNRIYSFNLIDAFSNYVYISPYNAKCADNGLDTLIKAWNEMGIPKYLQVDNELSFKGSNLYPRSFGKIIRLCLFLGVEIIFVPESEPWRQGIIEKFNDVYNKTFFYENKFENLEHLRKESCLFASFHNNNHVYSKLNGKPPAFVHKNVNKNEIKNVNKLKKNIPFREGKVSFIRLLNSKGNVRFFAERFKVNKSLPNVYIKGEICTKEEMLNIYYDGKLIKSIEYKVTKK